MTLLLLVVLWGAWPSFSLAQSPYCYTWTLVTDTRDLRIGDEILIAAADEGYALSAQHQNHYWTSTSIIKDGFVLAPPSNEVTIITLANGTVPNTFALQTSDGYLYAASNENNYLDTYSINDLDHNGSWDIAVDANGIATLIAKGANGNNILQYKYATANSPARFSVYRSTQNPVSLYKRQPVHSDTTVTSCHPILWHGTLCAESGFYSRVAGVTAEGCDSLQYLFLTLNPTAEVIITGDTLIAIGDSTVLHADGASFYQWSTGEGTAAITVSPEQTTTYYVTGTVTDCQSTVAAVTVNVVTPECSPWRRETDVSALQPGDRIVIAAPQSIALGMRTFPHSNSRPSSPIHKSDDGAYLFPPKSVIEQITLEEGTQAGEFALRTAYGYLTSPSADNNYLTVSEYLTDNASWSITPGSDNKVLIRLTHPSAPATEHNCLRFNHTEKYFACYREAETNASDCYLYKRHPFAMRDTIASVCGTEYLWHDHLCHGSGDYTRLYTGGSGSGPGCDTMVTLHLAIVNEDYDIVYLNPGTGACDDEWLIPGQPLPHAYPCSSEYLSSSNNGFAGWSPVPVLSDSAFAPTPLYHEGDICPPDYSTLYAVPSGRALSKNDW